MAVSKRLSRKLLASAFVKPKGSDYYHNAAKTKWMFWRLIVEGVIAYSEASQMELDEIFEANAALDMLIEKKNQAMKGGKK